MKLILEITFLDDTKKKFVCVDFLYTAGDFTVISSEGFKREYIRSSTISGIIQYFEVE